MRVTTSRAADGTPCASIIVDCTPWTMAGPTWRDTRISIGSFVLQLASEPENGPQPTRFRVHWRTMSNKANHAQDNGIGIARYRVASSEAPRLRIDPAAISKLRRANERLASVEQAFNERQASGARARSAA